MVTKKWNYTHKSAVPHIDYKCFNEQCNTACSEEMDDKIGSLVGLEHSFIYMLDLTVNSSISNLSELCTADHGTMSPKYAAVGQAPDTLVL